MTNHPGLSTYPTITPPHLTVTFDLTSFTFTSARLGDIVGQGRTLELYVHRLH